MIDYRYNKESSNTTDWYKFECIDVMRDAFGLQAVIYFSLLSAFKYLYRCQNKYETPLEDIKKAKYYIDYAIKKMEELQENE